MDKLDLYKCNICGNIIEVIINGGGELVCCGQPMKKIEPQYHEQAIEEKHVPIFIKNENEEAEIRVGEVLHPMTNEHYIQFIQVISHNKNISKIKFLYPNEEPKFNLNSIDNYDYAREFCNLHGLWEGKNND